MADTATQRANMVEGQVRTNDVTDPRVYGALREVPRERFVPTAKRALAYADVPVEIAPGRFLLDPRTFGKMLQLAAIKPTDHVLDVACGTGYSAVVLGKIAKSVIALEQDADLVRVASDMVPSSGAANVTVVQGGLTEGVIAKAPYDVILIEGAVDAVPDQLLAQLAEAGRLVIPIATDEDTDLLTLLRRHGADVETETITPCRFVPLIGEAGF